MNEKDKQPQSNDPSENPLKEQKSDPAGYESGDIKTPDQESVNPETDEE